jgi:hypothetical protein
MIEEDLTGNLRALLVFIERHIASEIPVRGTFDPYGILLRRGKNTNEMVFLETTDDSNSVLKGKPASQMARRIEDMIRQHQADESIASAALIVDRHGRTAEGEEVGDAVFAWLDDRGRQSVRIIIQYELTGGNFRVISKTIEPRDPLFLPAKTT